MGLPHPLSHWASVLPSGKEHLLPEQLINQYVRLWPAGTQLVLEAAAEPLASPGGLSVVWTHSLNQAAPSFLEYHQSELSSSS